MLSLTRHQWAVLLAAWLGWGFVRGTLMAVVVLITWWSCNAFIPSIATGLAQTAAQETGLDRGATLALVESWKTDATAWFNLGGLVGTLLTIPVAKPPGSQADVCGLSRTVRHLDLRGLRSVFGVFGSFTFYLPELFPTRLRGFGPLVVGSVAARGVDYAMQAIAFVALVPPARGLAAGDPLL